MLPTMKMKSTMTPPIISMGTLLTTKMKTTVTPPITPVRHVHVTELQEYFDFMAKGS
jgi:hypothetical protein